MMKTSLLLLLLFISILTLNTSHAYLEGDLFAPKNRKMLQSSYLLMPDFTTTSGMSISAGVFWTMPSGNTKRL